MKKSIYILTLAAAFIGCTKESVSDIEITDGGDFAVYAVTADTKTTNDGMTTIWGTSDYLDVLHAPAGSTDYIKNGQQYMGCKVENPSIGKIAVQLNGELAAGTSYDWWAMYPYAQGLNKYGETGLYYGFGSTANKAVEQAGNNSMAHIAGKTFPMYGFALNVASETNPTITMKHIASVVALNVTNNSAVPISIKSINFGATESFYGSYYVDFVDYKPSLRETSASQVSNKLTLVVNDGEDIAPGESAKFYFGARPMTMAAESNISIKIKVASGIVPAFQVIEKTLTEAVELKSGGIKTFNVSFSADPLAGIDVTSPDFDTLNGGKATTTSGSYSSEQGWEVTNGFVWDTSKYFEGCTGLCAAMNGKTSSPGTIKSPLIAGGLGTLTFNYGHGFTGDKLSFRVDVKDTNGNVIYTKVITEDAPVAKTAYSFSAEINYDGKFLLEFTNLCPSGKNSNEDRTGVFNLSWTNYTTPELPFPPFPPLTAGLK